MVYVLDYYSNADDHMVKVSFTSMRTVSILAPIQVRQTILAQFGSGIGA